MQPTVRAFGAVLASSALVLSTSQIAVAVPRGQPAFPVGAIDWKPCDEKPTVDCGFVTLPIDYAQPDGEKFQLAVSRRKANDPSQRIGAMVVNPGGPGISGVNFSFRDNYFSKEIHDRFDVIGFDPRGVSRSRPIKCSFDMAVRRPSYYPKNEGEFDKLVAYNKELREDCRKRSGAIFDHASTTDVANDIDSNMDHSIGTREFLESEARGAEDVFQEWVKWSGRTPSSPFYGRDLRRIWKDLLAKADRGELMDEGTVVTAEGLGDTVTSMAYGPEWKEFADYVAGLDQGAPAPAKGFAKVDTIDNPFAGIFCNDYNLRIGSWGEYQALTAMENRIAPNTRGSSIGHGNTMGCLGFPKARHGVRLDVLSPVQVNVLSW